MLLNEVTELIWALCMAALCRWIVQAMIVEIKQEATEIVDIHSLSPHQLKELLFNILTRNTTQADQRYVCLHS